MIKKMNDFTFKHTEQPDDLYTYLTSAQVKEKFDSRGIEIKTFLDNLIELLNTDGAKNIGISTIQDIQGNTLQDLLQNLRDILKSTQDSSSGADFINATNIEGVTGNTIQSILESLKQIIDSNKLSLETKINTHKISAEHDSRYYNKTELQSIEKDNSGADKIKATPISANSGDTVQKQLAWLLSQIAVAATGSIPENSLGEEKLKTSLVEKINKALTNTGVLTTLITEDKSSAVNAINEVASSVSETTKEIDSLKSSVVNGKDNLYSAIIGKKVTPRSKDFVDLVKGVKDIKLGQGNAQPGDVLQGRTFTNDSGIMQNGAMTNYGSKIITPNKYTQDFGSGYYDKVKVNPINTSILQDNFPDLKPENIVEGAEIGGIKGTRPIPRMEMGNKLIYSQSNYKDVNNSTWVEIIETPKIKLSGNIKIEYTLTSNTLGSFIIDGEPESVKCDYGKGEWIGFINKNSTVKLYARVKEPYSPYQASATVNFYISSSILF